MFIFCVFSLSEKRLKCTQPKIMHARREQRETSSQTTILAPQIASSNISTHGHGRNESSVLLLPSSVPRLAITPVLDHLGVLFFGNLKTFLLIREITC